MKNSTFLKNTCKLKWILFVFIALASITTHAQTVMYGDTIFHEDFGSGTDRANLSGRGSVGGLYLYEGPIEYNIALDSANLSGTILFHQVPISTSSSAYAYKPSSGTTSAFTDGYWLVTTWETVTLSSIKTDYTTETYPEQTDVSSNYPCSWILMDGVWKFGFLYTTSDDASYTDIVPEDGYYSLISDGDNLTGGDDNYLQDHWLDHTGWDSISVSPLTPADSAANNYHHTGDGRFLFVNCSQGDITGPVYKRQVTELCRGAEFEFSVWCASIHGSNNNSQFRVEIWSGDPGEDPSLGSLGSSYEGQEIESANNATLIKVGDTYSVPAVGSWYRLAETFTLTGQDYCWVVVRNYGTGSGNDIAIDDIVFKPYAPFNLEIELSTTSVTLACAEGLVTLLSTFPETMPDYIDVSEYGFYFQGYADGVWTTIGNTSPIQTQSAEFPLELTIPIAEYDMYTMFRVIVASTPANFGGKCITFTYPPKEKEAIGSSPNFIITGDDICDPQDGSNPSGTFKITNINQDTCEGWQVKVRMPDGTIQTLTPDSKATCE